MMSRTAAIAVGSIVAVIGYTAVVWSIAASSTSARYEAAVEKQKAEAARELAKATARVAEIEQEHLVAREKLEVESATNEKLRSEALTASRELVRLRGGLRDPGARPSCACPSAEAPRPAAVSAGPACRAELSGEATEFLLTLASEADQVVDQLRICQAWVRQTEAFTCR